MRVQGTEGVAIGVRRGGRQVPAVSKSTGGPRRSPQFEYPAVVDDFRVAGTSVTDPYFLTGTRRCGGGSRRGVRLHRKFVFPRIPSPAQAEKLRCPWLRYLFSMHELASWRPTVLLVPGLIPYPHWTMVLVARAFNRNRCLFVETVESEARCRVGLFPTLGFHQPLNLFFWGDFRQGPAA